MTGVHHVTVGDTERDPLLYLALGARAWITRIDTYLERYVPPQPGDGDSNRNIHAPRPSTDNEHAVGPRVEDERGVRPGMNDERAARPVTDDVAVVLGVLAVRARILRALESTADPAGHVDADEHDAEADGPPGWLR